MIIQAQVGPAASTASLSAGQQQILRLGNMGDLLASELHGRYYEATYRGTVFSGSVVGQVTTVALATTYTGLNLTNPIGSGVNIVLNKAGWAFLVAPAAAVAIGLMAGYNASTAVTQTTPVTPKANLIGTGPIPKGLLASSVTLPTAPTLVTVLGADLTAAITTAPAGAAGIIDLEGSIILPPGGYVAFYTSTASGAASGSFSFSWEEVPV